MPDSESISRISSCSIASRQRAQTHRCTFCDVLYSQFSSYKARRRQNYHCTTVPSLHDCTVGPRARFLNLTLHHLHCILLATKGVGSTRVIERCSRQPLEVLHTGLINHCIELGFNILLRLWSRNNSGVQQRQVSPSSLHHHCSWRARGVWLHITAALLCLARTPPQRKSPQRGVSDNWSGRQTL